MFRPFLDIGRREGDSFFLRHKGLLQNSLHRWRFKSTDLISDPIFHSTFTRIWVRKCEKEIYKYKHFSTPVKLLCISAAGAELIFVVLYLYK